MMRDVTLTDALVMRWCYCHRAVQSIRVALLTQGRVMTRDVTLTDALVMWWCYCHRVVQSIRVAPPKIYPAVLYIMIQRDYDYYYNYYLTTTITVTTTIMMTMMMMTANDECFYIRKCRC